MKKILLTMVLVAMTMGGLMAQVVKEDKAKKTATIEVADMLLDYQAYTSIDHPDVKKMGLSGWKKNPELSPHVKNWMIQNGYEISMTEYEVNFLGAEITVVIINRVVNGQAFYIQKFY